MGENYTEASIKSRIEQLDKPIPELIPDEIKDFNKHKKINKEEPINNNKIKTSSFKIHTFKNGQFITTRSNNPNFVIKEVEKMVDTTKDLKYQFNKGLKLWAEKHNLKQYLNTNRYIRENNIAIGNLPTIIKNLENEIKNTNTLIEDLKEKIKVSKIIKSKSVNNKEYIKTIDKNIQLKTEEIKQLYEKLKKDKNKLNNLKIISYNINMIDEMKRKTLNKKR